MKLYEPKHSSTEFYLFSQSDSWTVHSYGLGEESKKHTNEDYDIFYKDIMANGPGAIKDYEKGDGCAHIVFNRNVVKKLSHDE